MNATLRDSGRFHSTVLLSQSMSGPFAANMTEQFIGLPTVLYCTTYRCCFFLVCVACVCV